MRANVQVSADFPIIRAVRPKKITPSCQWKYKFLTQSKATQVTHIVADEGGIEVHLNEWKCETDGLVYNNPVWLREFRVALGKLMGFTLKNDELSYSEHGLQGCNYVHLDASTRVLSALGVNVSRERVSLVKPVVQTHFEMEKLHALLQDIKSSCVDSIVIDQHISIFKDVTDGRIDVDTFYAKLEELPQVLRDIILCLKAEKNDKVYIFEAMLSKVKSMLVAYKKTKKR